MRQTFVEEVLLVPKPEREVELFNIWHVPFDRFLEFAITHELGHAFCNEPDEIKADRAGQRLREDKANVCDNREERATTVAPRTSTEKHGFALDAATLTYAQLPQVNPFHNLAVSRTKGGSMPKITIRIYDFDHIEPKVIASAKEVTSEIFRRAGLQISWVDCISQGVCATDARGAEFRVRIVPQAIGEAMVSDGVFGFAIPCPSSQEACLCYILYWQIRAFAERNHIGADKVLGHVIAHEIGHMLLGPNAHAHFGIMQHHLPLRETDRTLYFTSGQAKQLRAGLLTRKGVLNNRN
jgi:hypothetical protein